MFYYFVLTKGIIVRGVCYVYLELTKSDTNKNKQKIIICSLLEYL